MNVNASCRKLARMLLIAALISCFIVPAGLAWAAPDDANEQSRTANVTPVATIDASELDANGTPIVAAEPAATDASDATAQEIPLITIRELISDPLKYDGMRIQVSGEAVGDIINSSNARYKWVNISADGYSLGVYMETGQTYGIHYLGAHGVRGTTIIVTGTFHAACADGHAGELDFHAEHVSVKFEGGPFEHDSMSSGFRIGAIILLLVGIEFYLFYAVLARRAAKAAGELSRRERGRGVRALLGGGGAGDADVATGTPQKRSPKAGDEPGATGDARGKRGGSGKRRGRHSGGKHGKR